MIIALLGMFATGVTFMYGLAIALVLAVLFVLAASLTVLPALLASFGEKVARPSRRARKREARGEPRGRPRGDAGASPCSPGRGRWRSHR